MKMPWKKVQRTVPAGAVASATTLRLGRWRDMPAFLWAAMRLRFGLGRHPGAVALALQAQPWRRTFWTLSVWEDEQSLRQYVSSAAHAGAMRRFRNGLDARSARWVLAEPALPSWREAADRVAASSNGGDRRGGGGGPRRAGGAQAA